MHSSDPLIVAEGVTKHFVIRTGFRSRRVVEAVEDVSFNIAPGEIVGLAGESGSGKSTLAEVIVGLQDATTGHVLYQGRDVSTLQGDDLRSFQRRVQIIFQDPFDSLNPRFTVRQCVRESLVVQGLHRHPDTQAKVQSSLHAVGLNPPEAFLDDHPRHLSGGQRQRVAIARALVADPYLLVADEPVSMLDVSLRTGILDVLKEMRDMFNVSILYISHDLSTIRYLCDRTLIMYQGRLVESGPTATILTNPSHPYTQALLDATPTIGKSLAPAAEEPAAREPLGTWHAACAYAGLCPLELPRCTRELPPKVQLSDTHTVLCHAVARELGIAKLSAANTSYDSATRAQEV